ncbi:MAG: hypothetical protein KC620_00765 [Myxococcales bacterium]|nr:hypothetical protein [Myxococcales bacterium]
MRPLFFVATALALTACKDQSGPSARDRILSQAASCEQDDQCADGFICQDKKCTKGERSAAEIAARKKEELAKKAAEEAAKRATKPGEGRMTIRICPGFKNTPEAIGTIIATHQETKQRHFIHMAREAPDLGWKMEFDYWSLPMGKYDVIAEYGIQKNGIVDTVKLKCDKDAKPCRDELIREMEPVPPDQIPPREYDEKGNPKFKACDFVAE